MWYNYFTYVGNLGDFIIFYKDITINLYHLEVEAGDYLTIPDKSDCLLSGAVN